MPAVGPQKKKNELINSHDRNVAFVDTKLNKTKDSHQCVHSAVMVRPTCPDYSLSVWLIIHVASGDLAKSFFAFPPTKGYFHTSTLQSAVIKLTVGFFFPVEN